MFPVRLNAREVVVLLLMVEEGLSVYDAIKRVYGDESGESIKRIVESITNKLNDASV